MSFLTETDEETFDDFEAEFEEEEDDGGDEAEYMYRPSGGIRERSDLSPIFTSTGGGVSQAVISTPQGQARVQLSRSVVGQRNFENVTTALRTGINRNTSRLNELQRDVRSFSNGIAASCRRNNRQLRRLRSDTAKWQKANTTAIAKARRESQNSTMLILLLTLLSQQGGGVSSNDTLVLVLALMMMGGGGGYGGSDGGGGFGGDNNMMMLLLVLLLTGNLGTTHPPYNGTPAAVK